MNPRNRQFNVNIDDPEYTYYYNNMKKSKKVSKVLGKALIEIICIIVLIAMNLCFVLLLKPGLTENNVKYTYNRISETLSKGDIYFSNEFEIRRYFVDVLPAMMAESDYQNYKNTSL